LPCVSFRRRSPNSLKNFSNFETVYAGPKRKPQARGGASVPGADDRLAAAPCGTVAGGYAEALVQEAWRTEKYRRFDHGERMPSDWRALASIQTLAALQYFPIVGFNNERRNHAEHDLRAPANKKYRPISPFRPQRLGRPHRARGQHCGGSVRDRHSCS